MLLVSRRQKERLLNVALARLPPACTKVAWLDCDLLFEDSEWIQRASDALETLPVIQPFTVVARLLRKGQRRCSSDVEQCRSFASVCAATPELVTAGDFDRHGHTGFGWAARRDWLDRYGLYDACMTGSADHLMPHAMCGDWTSRCIDDLLGSAPTLPGTDWSTGRMRFRLQAVVRQWREPCQGCRRCAQRQC